MKQILQNPTARLWCLSGLTGMVLMAGVLLDEGQARTYSPSPDIASIQINELNLHTPSSETEQCREIADTQNKPRTESQRSCHSQAGGRQTTSKKKNGPRHLILGAPGRGRLILLSHANGAKTVEGRSQSELSWS